MFQLYYAPAGWAPSIQDMLRGKHPIQRNRQYFVCRELRHNWRALLPDGFHLRFVDRALLAETHLQNLIDLTEEMRSERASVEDFLTHSFGVCIVHDAEIVGWCLSEYNSGQRCEVGIQTLPAYRRRGFATAMASAFIEHALDTGLTEIGWHCWVSNTPSIATARKVGFRKVKDYPVYLAWFDDALNLAVNGNFCLQEKLYEEALAWFEESFARGVTQDWAFWGAACASALLGRKQRAFGYLSQAIDHGFTYLDHMLKSEHLKSLHRSAQWDALVKRLQAISAA
jgi:RimJ/RimL family protein N-acetyltransferase